MDMKILSGEEISRRLNFGDMLIQQLKDHRRPPVLPAHLERERQELIEEQKRRVTNVMGDGI
jgi:hypothetical protein